MNDSGLFNAILKFLPSWLLVFLAECLAVTREEKRYPGWHFAFEEYAIPTAPSVLRRLAIWKEFAARNLSNVAVRVSWYQGLIVNLRLGNDLSRCLYVSGSFDPNELYYLGEILKPGMCFVDVGANEGFYTIYAARKIGAQGRVFSIEPSPREQSWLEQNISTNQLSNVQLIPLALADNQGNDILKLADAEHNGQNTLGNFGYKGVTCSERVEVELTTLDLLRRSGGIPKIDVIKIDVEGAEYKVLKGANQTIKKDRPVILIELFDDALRLQNASVSLILSYLRELQYSFFEFDHSTGGLIKMREQVFSGSANIVAKPIQIVI